MILSLSKSGCLAIQSSKAPISLTESSLKNTLSLANYVGPRPEEPLTLGYTTESPISLV